MTSRADLNLRPYADFDYPRLLDAPTGGVWSARPECFQNAEEQIDVEMRTVPLRDAEVQKDGREDEKRDGVLLPLTPDPLENAVRKSRSLVRFSAPALIAMLPTGPARSEISPVPVRLVSSAESDTLRSVAPAPCGTASMSPRNRSPMMSQGWNVGSTLHTGQSSLQARQL